MKIIPFLFTVIVLFRSFYAVNAAHDAQESVPKRVVRGTALRHMGVRALGTQLHLICWNFLGQEDTRLIDKCQLPGVLN